MNRVMSVWCWVLENAGQLGATRTRLVKLVSVISKFVDKMIT